MFIYQLKEERLWQEDTGGYTAFGICAYEEQNGVRRECACLSDVFLHREEAAAFAARCTALQLDVIHLSDAVSDVL